MNPLLFVVASILLVAISQLLFKKGATGLQALHAPLIRRIAGMLLQRHILLGLLLNALAAVCWLLALSRLELSFVFPFLSLNNILIPILAALFFQEKLSRTRLFGILCICIGIFLTALS